MFLILSYSLVSKLIYSEETIEPRAVAPFAEDFDSIMKDTYLKIVDIDSIREDQAVQISLPLRYGGCGLRTHTVSELQRVFVSSALLVAPAVLDATGYSIGPAVLSDDAGIFWSR